MYDKYIMMAQVTHLYPNSYDSAYLASTKKEPQSFWGQAWYEYQANINYDGRQKYYENLFEFFSCRSNQVPTEAATQTQNIRSIDRVRVEVARISFGSGEIVLQAGHYHVYADCGDEQAHYFWKHRANHPAEEPMDRLNEPHYEPEYSKNYRDCNYRFCRAGTFQRG